MKLILCLLLAMQLCIVTTAQTNLSGKYSYALPAPADAPATEKDRGPAGTLVLLQMEGNNYRFWLDVTLGWPTYAVGETDGTITFVNDTASFDNTFEGATGSCILKFKSSQTSINIKSGSDAFNCGFGNAVSANGDYVRAKLQPVLNNDWLKKEYQQLHEMTITSDKAEIYQDENALRQFPKRQFFSKGDRIFNISETEKTIYTEYISPTGKFIYGWVRRSDVKGKE
jgi:hypothetical protein